MFVFDVSMTCEEVIATPWHGFHKKGFHFAYVHNIHVLYSFMQPFHLDNFYLTWVDAPKTFYAPGMFDVSGTKEASKASGKKIMNV